MRRYVLLRVIVLVFGLLLAACASPTPVTTPTPEPGTMGVVPRSGSAPTPRAGTPTTDELRPIRQHLRDMQEDMVQLHAHMAQIDPQQVSQMGQLMAGLMDETARFMALVEQATDQMTPEEREAIVDDLQQMQETMQAMMQAMPMVTPEPGPQEPGRPDMGQMGRQMDQMHQQMRSQMQQMDPDRMAELMAQMGDLMGEMAQLMDDLEPVLDRLSPEARQALVQQAQRMQNTVQQMMQVGGAPLRTPMPATDTPTAQQPQVTVSNQLLSDDTVVVDQAVVPEPGWVVIHVVQPDGSAGQVIGAAKLQEGVNTSVAVYLETAPTEETELIAMLHRDTGEPETFNFPGGDPPFTENGNPVITRFTVQP